MNYYGAGRQRQESQSIFHEQLAHLNTGNTQKKVSNIASDEDNMENNIMFVMLWILRVIGLLIFPQYFFLISGAKSENNFRGLLREHHQKNLFVYFMILSYR